MAEVKSSAKPAAAALVTGFDTPEGQSVAAALARMGYRVCVVCSEAATSQASQLPGHERLRHEAIVADLSSAGAAEAAAGEAQRRLGHVTALVHVALPSAATNQTRGFNDVAFAREVQAGAGSFLGLAMGLLPGMLATQTGCLSVLTEAPSEGTSLASAELGAAASLGALLGAVRQIADRCEGTELRSITFVSDSEPAGANSRRALSGAATTLLGAQLGFERKAGLIPSGSFLRLAAPKLQGPIELLRPPPAPGALHLGASPQNGAHAPANVAKPDDRLGQKLAQTFRSTFGLAIGVDVSNLAVADVKRWDSLGHLKLMMEVEQALRVRLPAEALSRIRSYRDLEKAVRAYLPAT